MFIALPFICIILNIKIVKLDLFIAVGYCAFYYQIADFGLIALPNTIFRAFGGMCLGIIVWHFTEWIRVKTIRFPLRVMITVIEVFTFILPLFISFMNYSMRDFQLICFILWMAAIQSGQSLIPKINSSFFNFLGKLSMPIYVWHFAVICIINYFLPNAQMGLKIALFWILTFAIGIANLIIVNSVKNSPKKQPV